MNKIKKEYLSPELTVVEFAVEQGFAASDPIKKWTGWSIEQEIYMIDRRAESPEPQKPNGELGAFSFTGGGTFGSGNGTGGWLGPGVGADGWF